MAGSKRMYFEGSPVRNMNGWTDGRTDSGWVDGPTKSSNKVVKTNPAEEKQEKL